MRRFPGVDLVRALAALLVLLSHVAFWTGAARTDFAGPLLARGDAGVAVFFAVSAFLLLRPWLDGPQDARDYARRRAARILPAYYVALLAVWVVAAAWPQRTGGIGGARRVVEHLFLVQGLTGDTYQSFSQTWSLTTELCFYALVPLVAGALPAGDLDARAWHRAAAVLGVEETVATELEEVAGRAAGRAAHAVAAIALERAAQLSGNT